MSRALWKKNVRESRWLFLGCASILFVFCGVRVWIVSRLEMDRFRNILENLPESWQKLAPVPIEELFTYEGRVAVTFEEPVVYLMMAVWAITRASDSVSGSLSQGTMEMMVAQPLSRSRLLWTHTCTTLAGVCLLAIVSLAATTCGLLTSTATLPPEPVRIPLLGIALPIANGPPQEVRMSELVAWQAMLPAALNYACLGVFLTGITTFLSSWDRYRWRTIGLAVGFYVVETILELVGLAFAGLDWVKGLTFFSAYEPIAFVTRSRSDPDYAWCFATNAAGKHGATHLGPLGCDAILLLLGSLGIVAALVIFCRRDLPAPM